MNLDTLLLVSIVIALIYYLFIEFFSVLFRLTGLSKSKAKFQVISLLTNSGFTTQEAELIMSNRLRRRLASFTMFFGYLLTVAVISMLVNVIMTLTGSASQDVWRYVLIFGGFLLFLFLISRIRFIQKGLERIVEKVAVKFLFKGKINIIEVLDHYDQNVIAQISIRYLPNLLKETTLAESNIKAKYGIQILAIKRDSTINSAVGGDDIIQEDDFIVVFGKLKQIKHIFLHVEEPNH